MSIEGPGSKRINDKGKAEEMAHASHEIRSFAAEQRVRAQEGDNYLAESNKQHALESDTFAERLETVEAMLVDIRRAADALTMKDIRQIKEIIEKAQKDHEARPWVPPGVNPLR